MNNFSLEERIQVLTKMVKYADNQNVSEFSIVNLQKCLNRGIDRNCPIAFHISGLMHLYYSDIIPNLKNETGFHQIHHSEIGRAHV